LPALGDYRVLILPDHPTPVARMTHTSDPVPYLLFDSAGAFPPRHLASGYSEEAAAESGVLVREGHRLMERLISRSLC
jgi:2,3-bisphosphoglycerate-independent phosphoglycerate mutase